jgi:hypothetical protein
MTVYKRGSTWWAEFSIGAKRFRLSLQSSDHPEAARREKLRISEAQNDGGLLPRKVAKITVTEAAELYLMRRQRTEQRKSPITKGKIGRDGQI